MNSYRAAVLVAASVLMVLSASTASACSCGRASSKDKFAEADLIVKGRMKLVTFGVEIPDLRSEGEAPRLTRGDFEVDKVLKGTFKGKTLSVYTGAGMGDCGRLGGVPHRGVLLPQRQIRRLRIRIVENRICGADTLFYVDLRLCEGSEGRSRVGAEPLVKIAVSGGAMFDRRHRPGYPT
ncbi:hypothetical protein [Rhizobium leguminosarum]|uniref:hypothetical protein n=1 Tax=Rhizobium leguminosarum TaxID=384 RepID=UPI001CDD13DD|nr:hypothetical protein [Rhizobium leguminosarum]